MRTLENLRVLHPETEEEMVEQFGEILINPQPTYINLRK